MMKNYRIGWPSIIRNCYSHSSKTLVKWLTPARLKLYPPHIPALVLIFWGISQFLGTGLVDMSGHIIGPDYLEFFTAGNFYLNNQMSNLYNFYHQYLFQKSIFAPFESNTLYAYIYPPYDAVFFSLFSFTDYLTGLIIWWVFGLFLILLSVYLLRSEINELGKYTPLKIYCICFLFFPTLTWFIYGQNTPVSLILYTIIFVMLRRKNDFTAGAALGLLSFKPQLAIALSFMLLINGRWRALIGGFFSASIIIAAGFIYFPKSMHDYLNILPYLTNLLRMNYDVDILTKVFGFGPELSLPYWGIHSFHGFSILLLDNIWRKGADILFIILFIYGISQTYFIWRHSKWNPATKAWDLGMAATFALGLLISPQLFTYDLMLLLLPFAIVWSYYSQGTNGKPLDGGSLLFWSALLYIFCFIGGYITFAQLKFFSLLGLPQFAVQFSTLVIIGWVYAVINEGRTKKELFNAG